MEQEYPVNHWKLLQWISNRRQVWTEKSTTVCSSGLISLQLFKLFLIKRKTKFSFLLIQHLKILIFLIKFWIIYNYNLPPSHHPHFSAMFSGKLHDFSVILNAIWAHYHDFQKSAKSRFILTAIGKYCNNCNFSRFIKHIFINMQHQFYVLLYSNTQSIFSNAY